MNARSVILYLGVMVCGSATGYFARDIFSRGQGIPPVEGSAPTAGGILILPHTPNKNAIRELAASVAKMISQATDFDRVAHLLRELLNLIQPEWIETRCATYS